jgi:hypothetical protein
MLLKAAVSRRAVMVAGSAFSISLLAGCGSGNTGRGPNFLGTFPMGEKVRATPLIYSVLEAEWKPELTEGGRAPKHRYLFIRVSISNSGGATATVPAFQLESMDGKTTYQEVMEGMDEVSNWLGMIRSLEASQTQQGYIVFDAPMAAYKLLMYDGQDIDREKYAIVEIPVSLEGS